MTDNTQFSITCIININEANHKAFYHCLDGVLNQQLMPEKLAVVNSRYEIDKLDVREFFILTNGKFPAATQYKRANPCGSKLDLQRSGFDFVTEKFTKHTPLFMWLDASHFIRPNFLSNISEIFNKNKYSCFYKFDLLPLNGRKTQCINSFVVASQLMFEFLNSVNYNGINGIELIEKITKPLPWVSSVDTNLYVEQLNA